MSDVFQNRVAAGKQLAWALAGYTGRDDLVVLALPRGGVPVGYEVAKALRCPLDGLVVRKLGAPHNPEPAMGAIASGDALYVNNSVLRALDCWRVAQTAASARVVPLAVPRSYPAWRGTHRAAIENSIPRRSRPRAAPERR